MDGSKTILLFSWDEPCNDPEQEKAELFSQTT